MILVQKIRLLILLTVTIIILGVVCLTGKIYQIKQNVNQQVELAKKETEKKEKEQELRYINCINTPFISEETKEKLENFQSRYHKLKSFSFYFEDLENEYHLIINEEKSYYGASLIKLLAVLYVLENELSLDTGIIYEQRLKKESSLGMENHQYGELISLETLITYTLTYSDNTAYEHILNYIGIENLKNYALQYNIKLTINNYEHYSYLNILETAELLKITNKMLEGKYGSFLKQCLDNDYYNSLNFENTRLYHKYGLYNSYYHDIGIYKNDGTYLIAFLTTWGYENYSDQIQQIHKEIHQIYQENLVAKETYCQNFANKKEDLN